MNIRLLATTLLALAVISPVMHAQDSDKDTELGKHMSKIAKDYKKLRGIINDPTQNAASIAVLTDMKTQSMAGYDLKPEKELDLPADQQADFQAKFQAGLKEFGATIDKAIASLQAGDNAAAAKTVMSLGALERKDHKQFKKPKPDDSK
jgi:soluble cytochrome b562